MKQKLGQHFLKNKNAVNKIIAALDIQPNDTIIEIGPGKGALTFSLAEECKNKKCNLIAIEKDKFLAADLKISFEKYSGVEIVAGDALKILPALVQRPGFKIAGNIPYYITGKLLRIISELENKPATAVLMVQKEVAERITAEPPKMNLLAAATQFWAKPEIIVRLKPGDFDPPPEVDSAVIKLTSQNQPIIREETEKYYKLIHAIFKQPRKTLINNLREGTDITKNDLENAIKSLNLPPSCRPQDLSIENILNLLRLLR